MKGIDMVGSENEFIIKRGISPETVKGITELKVYVGKQYTLVYDKNNRCVGVVYQHYETRGSLANKQAEIRFFDKYFNEYGKCHRIFFGGHKWGERLHYDKLQTILDKQGEYKYIGFIRA